MEVIIIHMVKILHPALSAGHRSKSGRVKCLSNQSANQSLLSCGNLRFDFFSRFLGSTMQHNLVILQIDKYRIVVLKFTR